MKVGIGYACYISNLKHLELAKETLDSIVSKDHELVFCGVDNSPYLGADALEYFSSKGMFLKNDENNVSKAWNRSINTLLAAGCEYVIVPNLDLVFKSNLVDKLVDYAENKAAIGTILWTAVPWGELVSLEEALEFEHAPENPSFSCFMVDQDLFDSVGEFDENFRPAYNEDVDMHWRIVLAGYKAVGYEGARFYHHGSGTIHNDPQLAEQNFFTHAMGNEYFRKKWGEKPVDAANPEHTQNMYRRPFNKPSESA